jgi:hypothetical protein
MSHPPPPPFIHDGVAYARSRSGCLLLCCPKCGEEHFREPGNYFGNPPYASQAGVALLKI